MKKIACLFGIAQFVGAAAADLQQRLRDGEVLQRAAEDRAASLWIAGMLCVTAIVCALLLRKRRSATG